MRASAATILHSSAAFACGTTRPRCRRPRKVTSAASPYREPVPWRSVTASAKVRGGSFAIFKWPADCGKYRHEIQTEGVWTASARERLCAVADTGRPLRGVVSLAGLAPDRRHPSRHGDGGSRRRVGPAADVHYRPREQTAARTGARHRGDRGGPARGAELRL